MAKRWVARCDALGCDVTVVLDPIPDGDRWDYGRAINDMDWQAGPGRKDMYCPVHWRDDWDEKKNED